jgi:16S rRNA C1402 N4-methylase RsmH
MNNALDFVHMVLEGAVAHGSVVIDATLGNGHDAEFLAGRIGAAGVLYGFDIQPQAVEAAAAALERNPAQIRLYCIGHQNLASAIAPEHVGAVSAVVFNLGYLPGGDKAVTTEANTTIEAVTQALGVLRPGGVVTIVGYAHPEGQRECAALRQMLGTLPQQEYTSSETNFVNQRGNPPVGFVVYKRT